MRQEESVKMNKKKMRVKEGVVVVEAGYYDFVFGIM